jgi:hypothetical protein
VSTLQVMKVKTPVSWGEGTLVTGVFTFMTCKVLTNSRERQEPRLRARPCSSGTGSGGQPFCFSGSVVNSGLFLSFFFF